jgi:uncharacterized Fe-S center protein
MCCPFCQSTCPTGAIKLLHQERVLKALASAAYGLLSTFKAGKVSYVNFAKDITQYCDCRPNPGDVVMKDIGIFASDSPVSIDGAFLKMADYKIFNEAYGVDCKVQVQETAELGIKDNVKPKIETIIREDE